MASIKVKFRPSTVTGHEGSIYYQIIHERIVKNIQTDYHILPSEWDSNRSAIKLDCESQRYTFLHSLRERVKWDVERLYRLRAKLEDKGMPYTPDDVVDAFREYKQKCSFFNYMESVIIRLKEQGKVGTADTYTFTLNSFKKFRKGEDLLMDSLTSGVIEDYQTYLQGRGLVQNTVSFYMRILRAVYHRAVDQGLIDNNYPFRHAYTGVDKTVKRALPLSSVKKMRNLDLTLYPYLDYARDMFMMSFYLRGMSFVDMAFLRKTDLKNGYLVYRRRKTNQQLTIEWTLEMQQLLDKYPENPTEYLLPIITKDDINERNKYRSTGYNINRALKKIASMLHLPIPLTLYCARHSWASIAKAKGIPLSVISEGMGHDSEATTQIYLASLDTSVVDKANSLILKSL